MYGSLHYDFFDPRTRVFDEHIEYILGGRDRRCPADGCGQRDNFRRSLERGPNNIFIYSLGITTLVRVAARHAAGWSWTSVSVPVAVFIFSG